MADRICESNQVTIVGKLASDFRFDHEVYGEGFYAVDVDIARLSGIEDHIPVLVSERLIDVKQSCAGRCVCVNGQFRSYNRHEGDRNRLILFVFASNLDFIEPEADAVCNNQILLDGYVCKEPVFRETPFGRRITDLLIAVNRLHGKSDYIPCICWGRNAVSASRFGISTHVRLSGRIQSREYVKRLNESETERRIAYEVSASGVALLDCES